MKNKILIIDDDESLRNNLMELMHIHGYQAETAQNGMVGLLKIPDFMPDLIICDIDMPGLNGFQLLKQIRSQSVYNNTAFILLSARISLLLTDDETKLLSLADAYINKPISSVILSEKIQNILKKGQL